MNAKVSTAVIEHPALALRESPSALFERMARDPSVDVAKLERLVALQERAQARTAEGEYNAAMSKAQSEMGRVGTDSENSQTRSRYASYAALDRALRPIYASNGFALSFGTSDGAPPDYVRVCCHVSHSAGHSRDFHIDMPADGKGAKGGDVMTKTHAAGSATTYGMRYLLKMIFNVAVGEDDDDGNAATAVKVISQDQALTLTALIEEVKADKARFLKYLSGVAKAAITRINDIPAALYPDAVNALDQKRKAQP